MTPRPAGHPLTVAQQEIWAYSTLYGADHRYLVAGYVHLHGRIDPDLFDRALRHVVTGVETLRVHLDTDGPEPRQVVSPCPERIIRRADHASHPDPLAAGLAHLRSVTVPYDLTTATSLCDHHLVDIGAAGFLWGLRAHHLILDGGGSLALVRAVAETYTALATGAAPPEYTETVADYVDEEQRYRSSRRYADDREFWRERLAGLGDAPEFAHPPATPGSHGPLRHRGSPSAEEALAVEDAARRHGVGTAALLAAAVALSLHADSGARTVVLGMAVPAKRSWRAFGMTSNVVGLRLEVDPCAPVGELVRATQREMATVLRHQHFRRFDLLAAEISPGVEHRVFGPALNFLPIPTDFRFGDIPATAVPESAGFIQPLGIGWYSGALVPTLYLDVTADHCDAEAAASLHARLLSTLRDIAHADADTPAGRIGRAAVPASPDRHEDPDGDTERSLPEVFDTVALRYPERAALWYEGEHLTYAELRTRADRFARHLAADHGVGLGTSVGVRLPRTPELVVAVLALMRLGALCVPLHEQDPPDRVAWVLAHTGTDLVLDDNAAVRAIAVGDGPVLDTHRRIPPDTAAWLLFTSGSTGTPKGAIATHRAMVARATDRIAAGPEYARMLMHSPHAWDMVVWELWMPLLQGHTAVLATPDRMSAEDFRAVLREGEVTAMLLAAGLFQVLVEEIPDSLARLRTLSAIGDVLAPAAVAAMRAAAPDIDIVNLYGPVEATAYATAHPLPPGQPPDTAIPIGRAVEHTQILLLDKLLRPVPPGMVGEIYLTGAGLARGYHRMPARTATTFTANPLGAPGARMYRTGDYGSWDHHGQLRFHGRGDRQVKVNGIRVEPAEIEHAIRQLPAITAAVVTAHRMATGKTLIAHVVSTEDIDVTRMRQQLGRTLPAYLLPATIVRIPRLPLTANGKIDRTALTVPVSPATAPPRTPRQQILAGLFADAIGRPGVGVDDDFFRVGGNSLSAVRLAATASRALGTRVTLRELLDFPTVADLDRHLATRRPVDNGSAVVPSTVDITPRDSAAPPDDAPLTPAQQRFWTVNYLGEGTADYLMTAALDLRGPLDTEAMRAALGDVVLRHEILRTTLPFTSSGPVQRVAAFDPAALDYREVGEVTDLRAELARETARGFSLLTETPLRVRLFRQTPSHHVLLVVLHHSAGDAESLALLLRDCRFAYSARRHGAAPAWPAPPVQFPDYARWLHTDPATRADDDSAPARYWRATLAGLDYHSPLAVDRPRRSTVGHPGAIHPFTLDATTHAAVLDTARRCGATTYTVLHAALVSALRALGAGPDIVLGTMVSGRDRPELDTMLGCAADVVPIRTDLDAARTARELVDVVRDRLLDAHDNRRYPYERAVAPHTGPDRPLPQIVTTFFRRIEVTGTIGDRDGADQLVVGTHELPSQRAEFEILVQIEESLTAEGEPGGLHGEIRYAAPLWEPSTIAAVARAFDTAVRDLCTELAPGSAQATPDAVLTGHQ